MRTVRALLSTIVAVLMLGVAGAPAQAQTRPAPPAPPPDTTDYSVGVGALGGLTLSTLKGDAETNAALQHRTGYMAGIWFGGNYNARVGLIGEVDYVVKGTREREFDGELEIHYLEVPVLVHVNIARSREGASLYAIAGPALGLRLKATLLDPDGDLDVKDGYETLDFGLVAGAGVQVKRFGAEVRANWGLRNIEVDPGEGATAIKNFSIQVLGKFRFN